ncbi:MAG: hypothetical protein IH864_07215 [Chloroflexi bacterium]|nr:hypothetical protein [Chloroflexota bacterium]
MSQSTTIIAALKFQGGVVIGADSQVSDLIARVRWPLEKLDRLPAGQPCVMGFSGSLGRAQQARAALDARPLHANQFRKRELVRAALERCLSPVYEAIENASHPPREDVPRIALWALAAMWAEDAPQILEFEINGDNSFHDSFHAIGSASATAYAIYRTLGGTRMSELEEAKALMALIRIIRTCVNVEMWGISEPVAFWLVGPNGARTLSEDELQPHLQAVDEWEKREREALLGTGETD